MWHLIKSLLPISHGIVAAGGVPPMRPANGIIAHACAGLAGFAIAAREALARLLARKTRWDAAAAREMCSMGARELNDLGIGAGEIPYLLNGGTQGARWADANRSLRSPAAKP